MCNVCNQMLHKALGNWFSRIYPYYFGRCQEWDPHQPTPPHIWHNTSGKTVPGCGLTKKPYHTHYTGCMLPRQVICGGGGAHSSPFHPSPSFTHTLLLYSTYICRVIFLPYTVHIPDPVLQFFLAIHISELICILCTAAE
jgi:hypothetical protein